MATQKIATIQPASFLQDGGGNLTSPECILVIGGLVCMREAIGCVSPTRVCITLSQWGLPH